MTLSLHSTVTLNNGVEMPVLGLGTFQSKNGGETRQAVGWALEAGYRHIDTAAAYGNEEDVGAALLDSGIPRQEIFITTKIWNADQGFDSTLRAYDASCRRLGVERVDLLLIHWPIRGKWMDTWRALVQLYQQGRVRAIGVSNYTITHLRELLAASPVVPAVNQYETSPFNTRRALADFCRARDIQVESYSPLVRGRMFGDPTLKTIAGQHGKSPAQVLVRWALEKGLVVIPKSIRRERIIENAAVFDFALSAADMQQLDGLNEDLHTIQPPWMIGEWDGS